MSTAILTSLLALSQLVSAKEELTFDPEIRHVAFDFPRDGYWQIKETSGMYAPYKNDVLKKWQNALRERGITNKSDLQILTAQALQENGALAPDVVGDHGCSLGLPQRNFCSHAGIYASTAVQRWPEWKDIDFQIGWFADNMKRHLDEQKNIKWAVIAHNRPASARSRTVTVYWKDVNDRKASIEWIQ